MSKLRTLSLALVKMPGDESMQSGAVRIALSNPHLTRFKISYLPANSTIRRAHAPPRPIEQGRYLPIRDGHGIPVSLLAIETWHRFGGFGAKMTRRSVYELRPSGHPDAVRKAWKHLLFEKSPAGEEARLLVFSCWLLILAMWGILRGVVSSSIDGAQTRASSRAQTAIE